MCRFHRWFKGELTEFRSRHEAAVADGIGIPATAWIPCSPMGVCQGLGGLPFELIADWADRGHRLRCATRRRGRLFGMAKRVAYHRPVGHGPMGGRCRASGRLDYDLVLAEAKNVAGRARAGSPARCPARRICPARSALTSSNRSSSRRLRCDRIDALITVAPPRVAARGLAVGHQEDRLAVWRHPDRS
jgi:hypothetical protein